MDHGSQRINGHCAKILIVIIICQTKTNVPDVFKAAKKAGNQGRPVIRGRNRNFYRLCSKPRGVLVMMMAMMLAVVKMGLGYLPGGHLPPSKFGHLPPPNSDISHPQKKTFARRTTATPKEERSAELYVSVT